MIWSMLHVTHIIDEREWNLITQEQETKLAQEMFSFHFLIVSDDHCHTQHEHTTSTKWKEFSWDKQTKTMTTFSSFSHPFFVDFVQQQKTEQISLQLTTTLTKRYERQVLRYRIGHHGNDGNTKMLFSPQIASIVVLECRPTKTWYCMNNCHHSYCTIVSPKSFCKTKPDKISTLFTCGSFNFLHK